MSRIFITGSADGLGREAARRLVQDGHHVVVHGRNERRAQEALAGVPGASDAVTGDLASIAQTRDLADQINALDGFDVIVHNAGIGDHEPERAPTEDGLGRVFQVNTLAPYLLTALVAAPSRLIYLSSGLHRRGNPDLSDLGWEQRPWNGMQAYSDSKLFDVVLAFAVARLWPDVISSALDPGWIRTRMGGPSAPGDLQEGTDTQVWLATSDDPAATTSGHYFYERRPQESHLAASDPAVQDGLLRALAELTGVELGARATR
jgi:NAD(P)-dependent dehydrogenase (short-subunit alcohol dehydrogenase family)